MCGHLLIALALRGGDGRPPDDFDRYWEIAGISGRPGASDQVEQAPLASAYFKVMALATGDRRSFRYALLWASAAADVVIAVALASSFGAIAAAVYAAVTLPLLTIYYMRFDLLPAMMATIAVTTFRQSLPMTAASALVAGVGLKLWPLPLCAWFARRWNDPVGRRATVSFVALSILLGIGWMVVGGAGGPGQVATFRGATGVHVESLIGGLIAWWDLPSLRLEADGWRVGAIAPITATALLVLAAFVAFSLAWNGAASRDALGVTWLASVTAVLLIAPALSPQYMVWIAPAIAIAWIEGHRRPAALAALTVPLTVIMLSGYDDLIAGHRWAALLIILRNAVLLVAGLAAASAVWRVGRQARVQAVRP